MLLLFNGRKLFLKCKLPLFAQVKLKGSNFTPYYLPLIWIEWKISIFFIKSKKKEIVKSGPGDRL